ncbi:MAG: zinc ribbon domain-containing protein [Candidatus Aenigmatarchaeota archaeon]
MDEKRIKEADENVLKLKTCPRCQEINQVINKFCYKCGMVMDDQTKNDIIKESLERKQADQLMDKLLEDPEFKQLFMKKIKTML